uniref:Uncharacterized protein n=1 Tax=Elphidium margaritaceum TaxID=933848 RepID=A0A7S0THK9_9EUKA
MPDDKDILMVRIRSIGVVQKRFNINKNMFEIYDAGGQRSERKKWMHHFGNVQAVIFVAALNHYCARLFEDETVNGMHESIRLFATICNEKHFEKTEMILFLNKNDLFRDRLSEGTTLRSCFHQTAGWDGEQWDKDTKDPTAEYEVMDYVPNATGASNDAAGAQEDSELFEQSYAHSVSFIQRQYSMVKENTAKLLYVHVTTATNKENVSKVFWDVQNMIIRKNLLRGGIV